MDVGWARSPQRRKLALQEGRLVPDEELRQERLQVGSVANESDVRHVTALLTCRQGFDGCGQRALLGYEDSAAGAALEHTDRGLVQINAEQLLPRGHLLPEVVEPLPTRSGLEGRNKQGWMCEI